LSTSHVSGQKLHDADVDPRLFHVMGTQEKSTVVAGVIPILAGINLCAATVVVRLTPRGSSGLVPAPLHIWQDIAAVAFMWTAFLAPVALVIAVLAAAFKFKRTRNASLAFFLSDALLIVCFYVDAGHVMDWLFD
jgi:hypothetical protein